ncbi:hypothetical protein HYQ46_006212 [Verticillium longisporum]|nr:hypothetical protein HYQ46_006212 [Verticillium longisporum]
MYAALRKPSSQASCLRSSRLIASLKPKTALVRMTIQMPVARSAVLSSVFEDMMFALPLTTAAGTLGKYWISKY